MNLFNLKKIEHELENLYGGSGNTYDKLEHWHDFFEKLLKGEKIKAPSVAYKVANTILIKWRNQGIIEWTRNLGSSMCIITKTDKLTVKIINEIADKECKRFKRSCDFAYNLRHNLYSGDIKPVKHEKNSCVKCYKCGYIFLVKEIEKCPLCKSDGPFYEKRADFSIITQYNREVISQYLEGKKGSIEGLPIISNPIYYVLNRPTGWEWELHMDDIKSIVRTDKLLYPKVMDFVSPGLMESIKSFNAKIKKENKKEERKGKLISVNKIYNSIKFEVYGNLWLIHISTRLKGYILLLKQNRCSSYTPDGRRLDYTKSLSNIDKINSAYETQQNMDKMIEDFVSKTMNELTEVVVNE